MAPTIKPKVEPKIVPNNTDVQAPRNPVEHARRFISTEALQRLATPLASTADRLLPDQDWDKQVSRLKGQGDSALARVTPETKADVSVGAVATALTKRPSPKWLMDVMAGIKGQTGQSIRVMRESDAANSTYLVSFDKRTVGAGTMEKGWKLPRPGTEIKAKGEVGLTTSNSVSMRFATASEAARAARILDNLAAADLMDDTLRSAWSYNRFAGVPGMVGAMAGDLMVEGGTNNFKNPLADGGQVNPGLLAAAGVTPQDMQFLRSHVASQSMTTGDYARLGGEVKEDLLGGPNGKPWGVLVAKGAFGVEPRTDATNRQITSVDYPSNGQPGMVTRTTEHAIVVSAKAKTSGKLTGQNKIPALDQPGFGQSILDAVFDLHTRRVRISQSQAVPPGTSLDMATLDRFARDPKEVKITVEDLRWNALADPANAAKAVPLGSRTDLHVVERSVTVRVEKANQVADAMRKGHFDEAQRLAGGRAIAVKEYDIARDGHTIQAGLKGGIDKLAQLESTQTVSTGIDVILERPAAKKAEEPRKEPLEKPALAGPQGKRMRVIPTEGINLRAAPGIDSARLGVLANGTYVDTKGETKHDANGVLWLKVLSRDVNHKPVEGWVRHDNLERMDPSVGTNSETGRVSPQFDKRNYTKVVVQEGDNMWDLARKHGVNFQDVLKANGQHVRQNDLIFPGDVYYFPNSGKR